MMEGCLVMRSSDTSARAGAARASASEAQASQVPYLVIALILQRLRARSRESSDPPIADRSAFRLSLPPLAIARKRIGVRRVRSRKRTTFFDFHEHKFLEDILLPSVARDFVGEMARNDR